MKQSVFKLLGVLSLMILFSCNNNEIKQPEQIGKHVFEILKTIDTKSKVGFANKFPSLEEVKELGNNKNVATSERAKKELSSTSKADWTEAIYACYENIKKKGERDGINWEEIEYLDFNYKVKITNDGIKLYLGSLYFKFNDKSYQINVVAVFNGKEYKLIAIVGLKYYYQ